MTTFEWVSLIFVLLGGFWTLTQKLAKIEAALVGKVGYKECSEKRDNCPCVKELEEIIKERMERR